MFNKYNFLMHFNRILRIILKKKIDKNISLLYDFFFLNNGIHEKSEVVKIQLYIVYDYSVFILVNRSKS